MPQAQVYPRVCGGSGLGLRHIRRIAGLSPRVRGKLVPVAAGRFPARSIPACAGEA